MRKDKDEKITQHREGEGRRRRGGGEKCGGEGRRKWGGGRGEEGGEMVEKSPRERKGESVRER